MPNGSQNKGYKIGYNFSQTSLSDSMKLFIFELYLALTYLFLFGFSIGMLILICFTQFFCLSCEFSLRLKNRFLVTKKEIAVSNQGYYFLLKSQSQEVLSQNFIYKYYCINFLVHRLSTKLSRVRWYFFFFLFFFFFLVVCITETNSGLKSY